MVSQNDIEVGVSIDFGMNRGRNVARLLLLLSLQTTQKPLPTLNPLTFSWPHFLLY